MILKGKREKFSAWFFTISPSFTASSLAMFTASSLLTWQVNFFRIRKFVILRRKEYMKNVKSKNKIIIEGPLTNIFSNFSNLLQELCP